MAGVEEERLQQLVKAGDMDAILDKLQTSEDGDRELC